jgi:hypothetical protein
MLEAMESAKRRAAILAAIARLGPVVPGTISQRSTSPSFLDSRQ